MQKKRGPLFQKSAIFRNAFVTKKSWGTQFLYIWWYPKRLGVPETHLLACYSPKYKLPFLVCKLQHQYIILTFKQLFNTKAIFSWFYGRYILLVQYRITYKVFVYIFDEMEPRNLNNNHSSRNVPKIIFFSLHYWLFCKFCSQFGLTDL